MTAAQRRIGAITLVVGDYDEAIAFYTGALGFELLEDTDMGHGKRWVLVSPGANSVPLLLARAADEEQARFIGNQTGGRVFLFLYTDNFQHDYARMQAHGVRFLEEPRSEAYGTVVVFEDCYGNKWDLLEPRS